jgi:hypothetical protein
VLSKDLSFVWDCSFENGNIVFGDIIGSYMGTNGNPMMPIQDIRSPIKDSIYDTKNGCVVSLFQNFASYHLTIYKMQNKQIMPVFMLIFNDDTFSFLPFTATTKATFYRMTLYVIKMIKAKGIKTVFYAGEYYSYPVEQIGRLQKPYEKRVQLAEKTFFSCSMISKDFSTMLNIDIDIAKMEDMDYIKEKINSPQPAIIGWLQPIYDSFNK